MTSSGIGLGSRRVEEWMKVIFVFVHRPHAPYLERKRLRKIATFSISVFVKRKRAAFLQSSWNCKKSFIFVFVQELKDRDFSKTKSETRSVWVFAELMGRPKEKNAPIRMRICPGTVGTGPICYGRELRTFVSGESVWSIYQTLTWTDSNSVWMNGM